MRLVVLGMFLMAQLSWACPKPRGNHNIADGDLHEFLTIVGLLSNPSEKNQQIEACLHKILEGLTWDQVKTMKAALAASSGTYGAMNTADRMVEAFIKPRLERIKPMELVEYASERSSAARNITIEVYFGKHYKSLTWTDVEILLKALGAGRGDYALAQVQDRIAEKFFYAHVTNLNITQAITIAGRMDNPNGRNSIIEAYVARHGAKMNVDQLKKLIAALSDKGNGSMSKSETTDRMVRIVLK